MGPCIVRIFQYISNKMQSYTVYCIWKLFYMLRVVPPPIIRTAYNCIYSIWYMSHRYCYLSLTWRSWNRFQCAVDGVRHHSLSHTVLWQYIASTSLYNLCKILLNYFKVTTANQTKLIHAYKNTK